MPIVLKPNEDSLIYDNVFGNCLLTAMFQLHQAKSLTDIFDWTVYSMQLLYYLVQKDKTQGILKSNKANAWKKLFRD